MPKEAPAAPPAANPDAALCDHYIARKRRFCRTEKRVDSRFCHTHSVSDSSIGQQNSSATLDEGDESHLRRVPCPINPNHTVYASRLQRHVRVCPDLRFVTSRLPYYREDAHAFRGRVYCGEEGPTAQRITHSHLPASSLHQLIARVRECYFSVVQPQMVLMAFEECPAKNELPHSTRNLSSKHGPQHCALLRCAERAMCSFYESEGQKGRPRAAIAGFVELGAGKGGLSVALQSALTSHSFSGLGGVALAKRTAGDDTSAQPLLVVIDVDNFRRKGDGRVCRTALPLVRLRVNIKDLDLARALSDPSVRHRPENVGADGAESHAGPRTHSPTSEEHWVALGKHLCGACTDFALSCVTSTDDNKKDHPNFIALVLATCCHHRCELQHLNSFLLSESDQQGALRLPGTDYTVSSDEFAAIASMSSWAVSGAFVDEERRLTGVCCKRVIDAWRVAFLKHSGYRRAYLCQYTGRDVTEENVCIVAHR